MQFIATVVDTSIKHLKNQETCLLYHEIKLLIRKNSIYITTEVNSILSNNVIYCV
jgi:hypothetical protein